MIWLRGLAGFGLGTTASVINLLGLWTAIKIFTAASKSNSKIQPILIVLTCFLKMPLFIAAGVVAKRLQSPSPQCFLAGVVLVYSTLIWWVARTR
jgi:hypothetical protein